MKVINYAEYPVQFVKNGKKVFIPYDGRVREIPDDFVTEVNGLCRIVQYPRPKAIVPVNPVAKVVAPIVEVKKEEVKPAVKQSGYTYYYEMIDPKGKAFKVEPPEMFNFCKQHDLNYGSIFANAIKSGKYKEWKVKKVTKVS